MTLAADKAYDVAGFVADLRQYNVTPHVARNTTHRRSAIDARTTRHPATSSVAGGQAHRGGAWLDQGDRRLPHDPSLWSRPRRLDVH
jgi:hypothetical protein